MSVHLFTITHKHFTPPKDPLYLPLHVGRSRSSDLGYLSDHTGDSISHLNPNFCELTGMYWLWKNYPPEEYIGICHYRRYLLNEHGSLFTKDEIRNLLSQYDILTTRLLTLPNSYRHGFCANHHERDLQITEQILQQNYPAYHSTFLQLVNGPHTYFGNIFVTSRERYDQYCAWLFPLLFQVQEKVDFSGYNNYQKRLFGFLSEFLQTVWIRYQGLNVYECMVGMVGEKHETRALKEELAVLLSKRDYPGAKQCFLSHYEKRPDILMEASDINGELRLCMQIISTCEFEDENYQHCILDDIKEYSDLIKHFHRLNTAVSHLEKDCLTKEELAFLENDPLLSPIAVMIAKKLYFSSC